MRTYLQLDCKVENNHRETLVATISPFSVTLFFGNLGSLFLRLVVTFKVPVQPGPTSPVSRGKYRRYFSKMARARCGRRRAGGRRARGAAGPAPPRAGGPAPPALRIACRYTLFTNKRIRIESPLETESHILCATGPRSTAALGHPAAQRSGCSTAARAPGRHRRAPRARRGRWRRPARRGRASPPRSAVRACC